MKNYLTEEQRKDILAKGQDPKVINFIVTVKDHFQDILDDINKSYFSTEEEKIENIIIKREKEFYYLLLDDKIVFDKLDYINSKYIMKNGENYWFLADINKKTCLINQFGKIVQFPSYNEIEYYDKFNEHGVFILIKNKKIKVCVFNQCKLKFEEYETTLYYEDFDIYKINIIQPFLILRKKRDNILIPWNYKKNVYLSKEDIMIDNNRYIGIK